jgi:hypothetical protein
VHHRGVAAVQVLLVGRIWVWDTHTGYPRVASASNTAGIVDNISQLAILDTGFLRSPPVPWIASRLAICNIQHPAATATFDPTSLHACYHHRTTWF